jgi:Family of unknown function (DUF5681)
MPGPGVPLKPGQSGNKPGQSGNPKGRPRGSRHRLSERVLADLTADFEDHGAAASARARVVGVFYPAVNCFGPRGHSARRKPAEV